jgi:hypothetical protein
MSHDEGQHCQCVMDHNPEPLELEHHHILPLAMGGETTPENMAWICPTAHTNVHEILRLMLKSPEEMTYTKAKAIWDRPVNRYCFNLALEGYRKFKEAQQA